MKNRKNLEFTNLKEMLEISAEIYANEGAYKLKTKTPGEFKVITYKEFADDVKALGTAIVDLGLKDKRIAVISENRYEWGVAYLAIVAGTGVVVPLDRALPENEIENLMMRSEIEAIFYSSKYDQIMKNIKDRKTTRVKYFISMDSKEKNEQVCSYSKLVEEGKQLLENGDTRFLEAKIDNEGMGIMLFTSGTTSISKAVMLSHKNLCSNIKDIGKKFDIGVGDTLLSFLPLHHTFECTVGFLFLISVGAQIAFCDGIKHIADNLKEYQITAMITVPILAENMYKRVIKGIEKKGKLETVQKGIKISNFLRKFNIDIRKKIFKEIHDNFGGKLRLIVTGGAPLDPEIGKGFTELGVTLVQGYGLTETSPVIAAETPKENRYGSIGRKLSSVEVKIDNPNEDGIGELMAKGPAVMLGYYDNEEATKKTLEPDGWIHTGDLAKIDKDGYIYISGRDKNVVVLKNGKNIYPEEIENLISKVEGVKESFVYGKPEDDGDYKMCAKIVYDKENAKKIFGTEDQNEIKEKIWQEIKKINKTMPAYKYLREIIVTDKELIKTTTQKVKRHEELKLVLNK